MTIWRSAATAGLLSMPSLLIDESNWWDSPYINHFISADTVVSSYANPQTLNRYGYVSNNPLRYTDPTGHMLVEDSGGAGSVCPDQKCKDDVQQRKAKAHKEKNKDQLATKLRKIATGLDGIAWGIDLYNVGVVTYGGIFGAGIALPFAAGGPEVPVVTGLAGVGIAELAVQPTLQVANGIAAVSTILTAAADIRTGETNLKEGYVAKSTLNSLITTINGFAIPEAYSSFALQSVAVSNDFGWTSFPLH